MFKPLKMFKKVVSEADGLAVLLTVIIICLIIVAVVAGMMSSGFIESLISQAVIQTHEAFYLSDSGVDDALLKLARNRDIAKDGTVTWSLPIPRQGDSSVMIASITSTYHTIYSSGIIFEKPRHLKKEVLLTEYGKIFWGEWEQQTRIWYNSSWGYRKLIALSHHQTAGNLTDFPVLISITDDNLKNGAKADGSDIIFTRFDGVTKLKREIEKYASATGELIAWVKIPFLSKYAPTTIYMYYGNAGAAETNDLDVWDSNYKGVWHKNDLTTSTIKDSTANVNHGAKKAANEPIEATGKIAEAQDFDGTNDAIELPEPPATSTNINTGSVFAWIKTSNAGSGYRGIVVKQSAYGMFLNNNFFGIYDWGNSQWRSSGVNLANENWHSVGFTFENINVGTPLNNAKLYIDGQQYVTPATLKLRSHSEGIVVGAGNNPASLQFFSGLIDEVRISNIARSAEWIRTEYNNQSNPSNFHTIGLQQSY